MYRYLVTGGAGFIGSHLVDRLIDRGKVTVYDNLSSGRREFIKPHLGKSNFRFVKGDLLDLGHLSKAVADHDVVFHLAVDSDVRTGATDTDHDLQQGTLATYNVLEAMRKNQIAKIVFASSSTVYGEAGTRPLDEHYGPLLPISLYGASKLACEGLISAFCHIFDMQAWIFRFANIVGGRSQRGVIFDFIAKLKQEPNQMEILGDGTQEKPYLHVGDCVDGILFGWEQAKEQVNVLNLGCRSSTSAASVANMVTRAMGLDGVSLSYSGGARGWKGDVPQVRYDVSRMERLGWKPCLESPEAVGKAIGEMLAE